MAPVHFTRPINLLARCGIALPAGQTTRTGRSACNSSAAPAPTMRCCAWPRPRWPTSRRRSERHPHPAATTMKTSFRHLLCVLALALPGLASAMDYPDKPVRIVVPHPPDGASDTVARLVGQQLAQRFGQSVSAAWCTARAPCAAWRCCGCGRPTGRSRHAAGAGGAAGPAAATKRRVHPLRRSRPAAVAPRHGRRQPRGWPGLLCGARVHQRAGGRAHPGCPAPAGARLRRTRRCTRVPVPHGCQRGDAGGSRGRPARCGPLPPRGRPRSRHRSSASAGARPCSARWRAGSVGGSCTRSAG